MWTTFLNRCSKPKPSPRVPLTTYKIQRLLATQKKSFLMKLVKNIRQSLKFKLIHQLSKANIKILCSRYNYLILEFIKHNPSSMIEIGVWRGDRSLRFLNEGKELKRYVGFDLFEEMTTEQFTIESMGQCNPNSLKAVQKRIESLANRKECSVELISGSTDKTLPLYASNNLERFDFIYIDGGHSLATVANDWEYAEKMVSPNGLVVFDDYYLNDDSRGAKQQVDCLLNNEKYSVRFFPMVENIIDNLQTTMVSVKKMNNAY
jgi:hypothetical protein